MAHPFALLVAAHLAVAGLALALEAVVGYPDALYRRIGHPVTWMGAGLTVLERKLNRGAGPARRARGVVALAALLAAAGIPAAVAQWLAGSSSLGLLVLSILAASLPAQRSLYVHVRAVADALEAEGLEGGRRAVSMIVGRDPAALDEAAVARAAIESLAENFSDGVVAPAFWLAVGGLAGGALYKAANTADSMIGHRSERYADFGLAAARFDDLVNLPASRLAALWLIVSAGARGRDAIRCVLRDARGHRSPNAGWPEAAMAGALGLKLAGPRVYGGRLVEDAFMGEGGREATVADIRAALRLYVGACIAQFAALTGALALFV